MRQFCLGISLVFVAFIANPVSNWCAAFCDVGNGYGARLACGAMFGANRTLQSLFEAELLFPPVRFGREFVVNSTRHCVTVTGVWPSQRSSTACWHGHRIGCHLVRGGGEQQSAAAVHARAAKLLEDDARAEPGVASLPWPIGDADTAGTATATAARARVNMSALSEAARAHFADTRLHARALLVVVDGHIVLERYGDGCDSTTRHLGWSASKSVTNALVGVRIQEIASERQQRGAQQQQEKRHHDHDHGQDQTRTSNAGAANFSLETPLGTLLPQWKQQHVHSHLRHLTVRDALQMRDGLGYTESYLPGSNVTDMLFVRGSADAAITAVADVRAPPAAARGCFRYSSITTNVLCHALAATFRDPADALAFATRALFAPLGTRSFRLEAGSDGIPVGSSFGWATARDWARLGLLYMYDGLWWDSRRAAAGNSTSIVTKTSAAVGTRTRRLLPPGWVDFSATPSPTSRGVYGAHFWRTGGLDERAPVTAAAAAAACDEAYPERKGKNSWMARGFPGNTMVMHGFEEQCVAIDRSGGVVIVRLGATKEKVIAWDKAGFYKSLFDAITPKRPQNSAPLPLQSGTTPAVTKAILVHRAPPKRSNPGGPCSTVVHIGRTADATATPDGTTAELDGILKHISKTLGFPASRLQVAQTARHVSSDLELAALPDGTLVDVFEAESGKEDAAAAGDTNS